MKKITSLTLGISFLIMTYTGIMLFLCPKGKIAYWSNWEFLGLTKNQYENLHSTSMILMVFFGILHIYYNWKPIVSYLKDSTKKISFTKKEFLTAFILNVIFLVGTLTLSQPFKSFLDFNEKIKEYWEKKLGSPPYPHAEESKLKVFCKKIDVDLKIAKAVLEKNGIVFNENEKLETIAKNNNITPNNIYKLIKQKRNSSSLNQDIPLSLGRKTLKELADLGKIDLDRSIKLLHSKGLNDVTGESIMKNIADELDLRPVDVYKILTK